jgi:hypothetical protein
MYRQPYNGSFRYTCGLYQQSHSSKCSHNHVDGKLASKFALAAIRQNLLLPEMLARLDRKLRERAKSSGVGPSQLEAVAKAEAALASVKAERDIAQRNLARAKTDEQYEAISREFETLVAREKQLTGEISRMQFPAHENPGIKIIESALGILARLTELADDSENLGALGKVFASLNVNLFLKFHPAQKKKRIEQKLNGGLLTFGAAAPPIAKYDGPTSRRALQLDTGDQTIATAATAANPIFTNEEEKSSGNVSRGDRI